MDVRMRFGILLLFLGTLLCPVLELTAQEDTEDRLWPEIQRPEQTDATSLKLINLNLKARGGRAALESTSSVRFDGTLVEGKNDYNLASIHAQPNQLRQEVYRRHIGRDYRTVEATTGTGAWRQVVLPEKKLPQKISGLDGQLLDLEARIPFLFLDAVIEGATFVYRGEVRYANQPVYLLHGWMPSGLEIDIHIDAKSFHAVNYRHPMQIGGKTVLVDRTPIGLKRAGDIWWERGHKIHIRGKVAIQVVYEDVQTNLDLGESVFVEPPTNEYWLRL
jgi:hypothetical protein